MRRSKLETYVVILKVLAHKGPLILTHIMYKANVNCVILKEHLDFLTKQGLVEERDIGKKHTIFAATQQGIKVLKYFHEIKEALPIIEEAKRKINSEFLL